MQNSVAQRLIAVSVALMLVSCSASRYSAAGPTGPQDLARYALTIEQLPDGQVAHSWKQAKDFDLTQYQYPPRIARFQGTIQRTSSPPMTDAQIGEACDQVYQRCVNRCLSSPLPPYASHYRFNRKTKAAALEAFCMDECAKERDACRKDLERNAKETAEFKTIDHAIDWLKRHKEEVAVGSVVVIAGVAFVAVVCVSGGCLLLLPVVLIASAGLPVDPSLAEASR
jgi:hypothetical protein